MCDRVAECVGVGSGVVLQKRRVCECVSRI
jgi:hypothetical protein